MVQAFLIGEEFIGQDNVCLILGDNIYYGQRFGKKLEAASNREYGATVFSYHVIDPECFDFVEFDSSRKVLSIEEKPLKSKSPYAVTGLYFYNNRVIKFAKQVKPSSPGELEITNINNAYLEDSLNVELLGRGFAWLDTETHESLLKADHFIYIIEKHPSLKVACLEEIGFHQGWFSKEQLLASAEALQKTEYGQYLKKYGKSQIQLETTKTEGLLILHPNIFDDGLGWFMESFYQQRFVQVLEE